MDARAGAAPCSQADRDAISSVLGPEPDPGGRVGRGGHALRARRHLLLPALHAVQDRSGWISPGAVAHVAGRLGLGPAEVFGVASFYHLLDLEPAPPLSVHLCDDLACRARGSAAILEQLEGSVPGSARLRSSPCLGQCERAPAALVRRAGPEGERLDAVAVGVDAAAVAALLAGSAPAAPAESPPTVVGAGPRLLDRSAAAPILDLGAHLAAGGFDALRRAVALGPEAAIAELAAARLAGRGGAAFPAARKWEAVRASAAPRHAVCNADESETGTFKDRALLERDPFSVLEGLMLAGFATGAATGWVYLRGEYPLARTRLAAAIAELEGAGWLGADAGGLGFDFSIDLRVGAGAYVCGEETALFNSIEGARGEPRARPPFPAQAGLFGRPTVVNNVETLASARLALVVGGTAFAAGGEGRSTGTRLFSVAGSVARPGVYEVPMGTRLADLLALAGAAPPRAVLVGGAAGSLLGPDRLDLPLSFEGAAAAGATLGSGAVMVLGADVDLADAITRVARFFRQESCGKCVPCRVGTVRQEELLARVLAGGPDRAGGVALLEEVAQAMRDASICGLGQAASGVIQDGLALGAGVGR